MVGEMFLKKFNLQATSSSAVTTSTFAPLLVISERIFSIFSFIVIPVISVRNVIISFDVRFGLSNQIRSTKLSSIDRKTFSANAKLYKPNK